jgi:hypothetical protein
MGQTLDLLKHRVFAPEPGLAEAVDGAVITALNEEAVVSAALGNKGGINLVVSYEAFAVKMLGALRQEILFARHQAEAGTPPGWLSVVTVATSHTWENGKNEQSHQDPTLAEALLGEMSDTARVLFPVDANSAAAALRAAYGTHGQFWTLVVPKRPMANRLTGEQAQRLIDEGACVVKACDAPEVLLIAIGAYQLTQALLAADRLDAAGHRTAVTCVVEPGRFRLPRDERERAFVAATKRWGDCSRPRPWRACIVSHMRPEPTLGVLRRIDTGPRRTRALGYIARGRHARCRRHAVRQPLHLGARGRGGGIRARRRCGTGAARGRAGRRAGAGRSAHRDDGRVTTMPTPSVIVRADKATKVYQRDSIPVPALHETSVEILAGDFVALVGPSGSGKTTLLNLIGGLDRPTSGRIWVGDQEITSLGRKALAEVRLRHIGFVFQEYNLVPVLSALENVEYVMLLQGVDEAPRRAEAHAPAARTRPGGPGAPPAERAVGRPAAACGGGARDRGAAGDRAARRADRQPRLAVGLDADGPDAPPERGAGHHLRLLDARPDGGRAGAPRDPAARRPHRGRRAEAGVMIWKLALRNVMRNRRRSGITVLSIAVGLAALTFLWGFIDGQNRQMVNNTTRYFAADAQVHLKGYHDDPSLDRAIEAGDRVLAAVRADPAVAAATVRLETTVLASRADRSRGIMAFGVDPAGEARSATCPRPSSMAAPSMAPATAGS